MENGSPTKTRGQWGTRLGFVLAAAGSAVGLGNIWKFPYITGEFGGGSFVLIYLLCIVLVGFPIMIAEVLIGRSTQKSPVSAFTDLTSESSLWNFIGRMGILAGFVVLSYYSVVAGWALNYFLMSVNDFFHGKSPEEITATFGVLASSGDINVFWHLIFMAFTVGIVYRGVQDGIERWVNILMPVLVIMLVALLVAGLVMDPASFWKAFLYIFQPTGLPSTTGVLEALGHAFFTLSLGMGAMLTYGSYLSKDEDVPMASVWVCVMDTLIAIIACLVIFPIIFSFGAKSAGGPGLVFQTMPVLFSQLGGGLLLSMVFFLLLAFAALSSAISLLEVVVSFFIDDLDWSRKKATLIAGGAIFLVGIPSCGTFIFGNWEEIYGRSFFDTMDHLASNWLLPLGGLLIAVFVGWFMDGERRKEEFQRGSKLAWMYPFWLVVLRFVVPLLVAIVFLHKIELLGEFAFLWDLLPFGGG